jgi:hypothetical protein
MSYSLAGAGRPSKGAMVLTRYLISFDASAMDHIPREDMPEVDKAAHDVIQEALNAGVWVIGAGLESQRANVVATDGTVTDGPYPEFIGGFSIIDVPSCEEALAWAAKFAVACLCAQEVRELMPDPKQDEMLRHADRRRWAFSADKIDGCTS